MSRADDGLIAILSKLDQDALIALARTVTQGLKKSRSSEEALHNIIKHSPNHISILRRKLVTRDVLFNYLDENNINVRLPATKNDLIDAIADFWCIPRVATQTSSEATSSAVSVMENELHHHEGDINVMAEQFANWFNTMLNNEECGIEHFFPDASLKLNIYTSNECDMAEVKNDSSEVVAALLDLKRRQNLQFNPNLTLDGTQGKIDVYGIVMVLSCGTLHLNNVCAGVFEQVFSLARDPSSDNNWKIKNIELNLKIKSDVIDYPKLCDSELTSELLMLPSD